MFTKKDAAAEAPATNAPKRSAMKSKALSILSNDLTVKGSIVSEGEVQLDGKVEGDVRASVLTIGEDATVDGEVISENVVIRGKVKGSVRARQVQLASTARVEGDVIHASLAIESGAYFDGHCKRSTDPLSDKPAKKADAKSAEAAKTPSPASPPPTNAAGDSKPAAKAVANDPFAAKTS